MSIMPDNPSNGVKYFESISLAEWVIACHFSNNHPHSTSSTFFILLFHPKNTISLQVSYHIKAAKTELLGLCDTIAGY